METKDVISNINKQRIYFIDYLKAFAIICVIIHHTYIMNDEKSPLALLVVNMAVPLFMIISGYTFSLSAKDKDLRDLYNPQILFKKLIRFTIPMLLTALLCYALYILGLLDGYSKYNPVKTFVLFNFGPGAYYYPLIIQIIVLFPLMYTTIKKTGFHGVIIIGLTGFICEMFFSYHNVPVSIYRITLFRYFIFIAVGIWLKLNIDKKTDDRTLVILLVIGILYIILPSRFGYEYKVFTYPVWKKTSMFTICYLAPIAIILFKHFINAEIKGCLGSTILLIGKSSYHIMYTQMIFCNVKDSVYTYLHINNNYIQALLYLIIAITSGIVFYQVEKRLFGKLYSHKNL